VRIETAVSMNAAQSRFNGVFTAVRFDLKSIQTLTMDEFAGQISSKIHPMANELEKTGISVEILIC
jgi:hypothetical protein